MKALLLGEFPKGPMFYLWRGLPDTVMWLLLVIVKATHSYHIKSIAREEATHLMEYMTTGTQPINIAYEKIPLEQTSSSRSHAHIAAHLHVHRLCRDT